MPAYLVSYLELGSCKDDRCRERHGFFTCISLKTYISIGWFMTLTPIKHTLKRWKRAGHGGSHL